MKEMLAVSNPNNKIGIKTLTEEQMRTNLPSYDMFFNRIDRIRDVAKEVDRNDLIDNTVESLKYDNILSIVGGRGAGKTSMLFSLYYKLKQKDENIVLPIIMPELIEENESIVSSILSAMKLSLDCIEKKIECNYNKKKTENCEEICKHYKFFERCSFNKSNELRKQFNELESAYYSKENKNFGTNYPENEELMAKSQDNSFNMINLFVKYWNSLRKVYSALLECSNKTETEPLIFIILDDTDLKPQVINELLFIIPKYFSHPNVVVLVSAAHKTLSYVVKNHMYKSVTGKGFDLVNMMDSELRYNKAMSKNDNDRINLNEMRFGKEYHKICRLSEEVLRKLFPVYNRFYLRNYDRYEDKKLFRMVENEQANCNKAIPISQKIGKLLRESYQRIILLHCKNKDRITINTANKRYEPSLNTIKEKSKCFSVIDNKPDVLVEDSITLYKERQPDSNLKTEYLSFFGKYPRDISAVYFSLEETVIELEDKLKRLYNGQYNLLDNDIPVLFLEHICDILLKFINSAINSNRKLIMFAHCANELIKPQFLNWQLYVDYSRVLEVFQDHRYINENRGKCDSFVEMICLLNFIEQLIVLVMPQRKACHGDVEFYKLMQLCNIGIIKQSEQISDLLDQYFTYHEFGVVPTFDIDNITHQHNMVRALENNRYINEGIDPTGIHDISWYELIAEVYYRCFDPFARISKHSDRLFIIKNYRFIAKEYTSFWSDYSHAINVKLKELANETQPVINKQKALSRKEETKNNGTEMKFWILHNSIDELVLSFNNISEIETVAEMFERSLPLRSEYDMIKASLDKLLATIRSEQPVKRYVLELLFDDLTESVYFIRRGHLELMDLCNQLEHCIDGRITLDKRKKENKEFIEMVSELSNNKEEYETYIDYCLNSIVNEIAKENGDLPSLFFNKNMRTLRPYMQKLENKEWYSIIEKEQ